jgi:enoyl-CoA hydratase/carnithine racemase
MEMLLTGEPITAQTALAWGLVNRVVAGSELRACTIRIAEKISRASACTVAIGKRTFYQTVSLEDEVAYGMATSEMIRSAGTPEAAEGISAFLSKRQPAWPETVDE